MNKEDIKYYRFREGRDQKVSLRKNSRNDGIWAYGIWDPMMGSDHKTSLSKFNNTEMLSNIFSDHNLNVGSNYKKKTGKKL